ncbi:MAG: hypothetical protein J6K04_05300 [Lachnospiraceae bacterium]|nr:hypothetical protein [Lachnospiraceae bacterium]
MNLKLIFNGWLMCGEKEHSIKIIFVVENDEYYVKKDLEMPCIVSLDELKKSYSGCKARVYQIVETKDKQELEFDEAFCKEQLGLVFGKPINAYQNAKCEKTSLFEECKQYLQKR